MKKFIVLTNGRSGSNYLVDVLNQHQSVYNFGEVLGPWSKKRKFKTLFNISTEENYLDFIYTSRFFFYISQLFYLTKDRASFSPKKRRYVTHIGIKDFGINFQRLNLGSWLKDNTDVAVIHLYRRNQLDRYISLCAMQKSGTVMSKDGAQKNKLSIDCIDLLRTLSVYEEEMAYQTQLASQLNAERVYSIAYEDLFMTNQKQALIDGMFEFLGLGTIKVTDRHKKILSNDLSDRIDNHKELVLALKNTPFEKYLG
ncbi:sulfotransferase domain-containing protein [Aliiglaciecola sp. M165]|uniref:sulfotransferase domain-containing protein n=1 Tax=Aliiglaciecola sp. M165 TaxID=2593649 RepID=UPI0011815D1E|nr:sulfotransferase domain-containing protein [Aliiglaciecola sp. M165]TRY32842.1 hypothetical protein FM019_02310 [Aliiglaciecola sp. M165]